MKRFFYKLKIAIAAFFLAIVMLGPIPTGLLYDLVAGTGSKIGQQPSDDVFRLTKKEELTEVWSSGIPVTIETSVFIQCPLKRLRDLREEGTIRSGRRYSINSRYRKVYTKYITSYSSNETYNKVGWFLESSSYNNYYLVQLEDGTYVCAFFDDYLKVKGLISERVLLPVGTVRAAESYERQMLSIMAKEYPVDDLFVVDMYHSGKIPAILDMALRGILYIIGVAVVIWIGKLFKKNQNLDMVNDN